LKFLKLISSTAEQPPYPGGHPKKKEKTADKVGVKHNLPMQWIKIQFVRFLQMEDNRLAGRNQALTKRLAVKPYYPLLIPEKHFMEEFLLVLISPKPDITIQNYHKY